MFIKAIQLYAIIGLIWTMFSTSYMLIRRRGFVKRLGFFSFILMSFFEAALWWVFMPMFFISQSVRNSIYENMKND